MAVHAFSAELWDRCSLAKDTCIRSAIAENDLFNTSDNTMQKK